MPFWTTAGCSALAAAVSLTLAQPAAAKEKKSGEEAAEMKKDASSLKTKDLHFVKEAAQGGMAEVKLGELAQQNASRAEVKEFGSMMVTDHTKANDDLKALAAKKGVMLSAEMSAKHQAKFDQMSKMHGADFDKAYVADMLEDHKKDVAQFEMMSQNASDPDVKAFATNTLPTLRSHLDHVKTLSTGTAMPPETSAKVNPDAPAK